MVAANNSSPQNIQHDTIEDFLQNTLPFSELSKNQRNNLARYCNMEFFSKGTSLLKAGETELSHLYLIQRGGIKSYIMDDEGEVTLKDYRGPGTSFGALGIIRGGTANLNIETVEDTFCFLLPRQQFLDLIDQNQAVAQYYLKNFSKKLTNSFYSELRCQQLSRPTEQDLSLFSTTAAQVIKNLHVISAEASIQMAASQMAQKQIGCLLVHHPEHPENIIGILTNQDLRIKVVAAGLSYQEKIARVMTSPVISVPHDFLCFDVLMKMIATGIHHIAVEKGEKIIGVITSHDIMHLQGHSPYLLFKEIAAQKKISGLYNLANQNPKTIYNLIREGAKAGSITRMIAILNDHVLKRLLTLLEEELGKPPVKYCWLLMGSEGRREQTFHTDQDNAIVYADPKNETEKKEAEAYFTTFAQKAINHLVKCGYPLCPGEIMAVNPKWCQPYSTWKNYFYKWMAAPQPQEILNSTIFFDFRAGFGDHSLANHLRAYLQKTSQSQTVFLFHLAQECLAGRAPLSFFKNFIVNSDGEHKNMLDIKRQGLVQFVNFARIMTLKNGLKETNTLARLQVIYDEGHISKELWSVASEAYEFQMQLRLIHQLNQIENGLEPDNFIDPGQLSGLEKRMLKDAFSVIERLQTVLKLLFPTI